MTQDASQAGMRRRDFMMAAGATLLTAVPLGLLGAADAAGAVDDVKGEAKAEQAGAGRPLAPKGPVFIGDVVSTGQKSRLALKLGERTTLKLGAEARLKLDKYVAETGGDFELIAGSLFFDRSGPPAKDGIQFRNAYGLIAVRGTRFYAGPSRGKFGILVGHGRVAVTAAGKTVVLGPQQGTDIAAIGAPPSEPRSWPTSRVREMQARFR